MDNMKKIGMKMSLLMGVTLSFFLSLAGNLSSGHFTLPGFLISFLISFIISMIIGFLVPMKKVNDALGAKLGLIPGKGLTRCIEAFVSDLIYTPLITFAMIVMAHKQATAQGASIPFLPMFFKSLCMSLVIAFVLIFICTPIFMKLVLGKNTMGDRSDRA